MICIQMHGFGGMAGESVRILRLGMFNTLHLYFFTYKLLNNSQFSHAKHESFSSEAWQLLNRSLEASHQKHGSFSSEAFKLHQQHGSFSSEAWKFLNNSQEASQQNPGSFLLEPWKLFIRSLDAFHKKSGSFHQKPDSFSLEA